MHKYQQQISAITLGVEDLAISRPFYEQGFGWQPVFENPEIAFFQMNGLMLGLFKRDAQAEDMGAGPLPAGPGAYALSHNVATPDDVAVLIGRLAQNGGRVLRAASAPPHGGMRGYVADPDGHAWEIAWNPAWTISAEGAVTFGL